MKTSETNPIGIFSIIAIGFLLSAPAASAQDNLIALGRVNVGGTTANSATTLGAGSSVATVRNGGGSGSYTITVTSPGAFSGADFEDFLIELTVLAGGNDDDVAKASVSSLGPNQLQVAVQIDDVEDGAGASDPEPRDRPFFFTIYRVPESFPATGSTKFLRAVGQVSSTGNLTSGVGVNGITVGSSQNGTGDYDVTLEKTGAFAGASNDDFVVILTVRALQNQDRGIHCNVSVINDDLVTVNVRVNELQDEMNDNNPEPINDQFYFTIYRIPSGAGAGRARSKLLVAMGRAPGPVLGTVPLTRGGAFDGGTVTRTRNSAGNFTVTIVSPGAFTGKGAADYAVQLSLLQSGSNDDAITGIINVADADTLEIDVFTNDVEQVGNSEGIPTSRDFFFFLYDAEAAFQPDLRIGNTKNLTQQKGDDIYNATAVRQKVRVGLPGTQKKKYFFSLENDGNVSDDIFLKARRSGKKIKSRYFRLTGGRKNVTAAITSAGHVVDEVAPSKIIKFEVQAKYTRPGKRPRKTLRFLARSQILATQKDVNKAILKPK